MAFDLGSDGYVVHKQKSKSLSQSTTLQENSNACFDCNICLDSCQEPVVTLCGHLYCWPCIYEWLQVQSSSPELDEQPKCPVCKAYISSSSLVPLYGRGRSLPEHESKKPQLDFMVPPRPPALGMNALLSPSTSVSSSPNQQSNANPFHSANRAFDREQYFSLGAPTFGSPTSTSFFSPTINMVSEIVFSGMFGMSEANLFAYPYSNSYPLIGNGSPRLRRQEIQLDKSLNRLSIFLFCCIALCLILF